MIEAIKEVLKGIDQTELESTDGWWETSAGAEFGAKKLKYILGLLAQPEQAPVAWVGEISEEAELMLEKPKFQAVPLYTTPPQRTWVGLTDDEMLMIYGQDHEGKKYNLGRMVQQALKEKNT